MTTYYITTKDGDQLTCGDILQRALDSIAQTAAQAEVDRAIARSISHNEIVLIDGGEHQYNHLWLLCDDHVDAVDGVDEFWGESEERPGKTWRVHMRRH